MSWTSLNWTQIAMLVGAIVFLLLLYSSIVYVPNNRVGILERLWAGKGSVAHGIIALNGEAGYAPDLLRGGFHVMFPFQYRVHKTNLVTVPQGEIGYVFARDGKSLEPGQSLAGNGVSGRFRECPRLPCRRRPERTAAQGVA